MKLLFYTTGTGEVTLRGAPPTRQWMDETDEAFAYRCLPLNIANAHGWEILSPSSFSVRWNGGDQLGDIDIRCSAQPALRPTSIFGHGVLTFHVHGVFRTEPGWNLYVGGSPNQPKDGIYPLSGVIETDWSPYTFTMNWRFTRPDHWISFDEGEPFCFVFPVQRDVLESVEPEIHDMASDPKLATAFTQWSLERRSFGDRLSMKDSPERKERWQKRYYRGLNMEGKPGTSDHQAKLRLAPFVDCRRKDPVAGASRRPALPDFFHKVVPLSRVKHGRLGLRDGNYVFASTTNHIPLAAVEFANAAQNYPLAFSGTNPPRPVCIVGSLPGINLYVDAAGNWRPGCYIPAVVRRFPFITILNRDNPEILTLGIEEDAAQLDPAASDKLFKNGEMTELCRERLQYATKLASEFEKTEALSDALPLDDLLMSARNCTPERLGARSTIRDLRVVDPERLKSLPTKLRAEWQANGWLTALETLVGSVRNWTSLLALEDEMSATLVKTATLEQTHHG